MDATRPIHVLLYFSTPGQRRKELTKTLRKHTSRLAKDSVMPEAKEGGLPTPAAKNRIKLDWRFKCFLQTNHRTSFFIVLYGTGN